MIKLGFVLGIVWVIGFFVILLFSFSSWVFDGPPPKNSANTGRHTLFVLRIFLSMFWWLMLLSKGGREMIYFIITGKEENE